MVLVLVDVSIITNNNQIIVIIINNNNDNIIIIMFERSLASVFLALPPVVKQCVSRFAKGAAEQSRH